MCIIFKLSEFHRTYLCFRSTVVVTSLGISKTWAKNTIFDKVSVLKIIILPSMVRFLCHEVLKSSQYIWFHALPLSPFSVVLSQLLSIVISLVLKLKTMKIKKLYSAVLLLNPYFLIKKSPHQGKLYIRRHFQEYLDFNILIIFTNHKKLFQTKCKQISRYWVAFLHTFSKFEILWCYTSIYYTRFLLIWKDFNRINEFSSKTEFF